MMYLFPSFSDLVDSSPMLQVPLWQILVFVIVISIAAVLERHRLVLVTSYIFTVHWVFIENLKLLAVNQVSILAVIVFGVFGLLGLSLTVYHMITAKY